MKKLHAAVFSTCLQNTDMMIPPAIAAASLDRETPRPMSRVSETQRKADAFIASTDKMIPPAIAASMASPSGRRTSMASSMDENDRKMAEIMQRTDRMKPN